MRKAFYLPLTYPFFSAPAQPLKQTIYNPIVLIKYNKSKKKYLRIAKYIIKKGFNKGY